MTDSQLNGQGMSCQLPQKYWNAQWDQLPQLMSQLAKNVNVTFVMNLVGPTVECLLTLPFILSLDLSCQEQKMGKGAYRKNRYKNVLKLNILRKWNVSTY